MRTFLFFICFFVISQVQAQNEFLLGGWTTANTSRYTVINSGPTTTNRVYRIDCIGIANDADIYQAEVIVDGVKVPNVLVEGSFVIVEGKQIAIRQVGNGAKVRGTWKVIQQADVATEKNPWSGYPTLNKDMQVMSLKREQEFVLSINLSSTGCTGTSMIVYIDGNAVKDSAGNPIVFAEGSSINGKGKDVSIRVSGTCGNFNFIAGDLKIVKMP
jgi:hypothetical protein